MEGLLAGILLATSVLPSIHTAASTAQSPPHIIIILADDLGWNDVSFHGSDQIPTPNIDALAYNGIILNQHYVPALCTPSRSSLLTGKYPTTLGMQHAVILAQEPWGLPLEETLMPQYLRRHGYRTHAIGKWHLGFHQKAYTPLYRGFDTFFGYYNGYHDYYDHSMNASDQDVAQSGYDMRRGLDVDYSSRGKYSTDLFTDEAVHVIQQHNDTQGPMFLYLAHLAPHTGNTDKPYQAPDEDIARFWHIQDPERRVYAAMVHKLDESVGRVISALRSSGKLENSIVLFMSDNGAVTFGVHSNHGSNFPLRGMKESPWEGGVRGVAAIWSPMLKRSRRVSNQLMHSSDWLPTLLSAAGVSKSDVLNVDGMDIWEQLNSDLPSPRTEVFHNFDEIEGYSSLRIGPWKYIEGTAQEGRVDSWYGDSGEEYLQPQYEIQSILRSEANVAIGGLYTEIQLRNYPKISSPHPLTATELLEIRTTSTIACSKTIKRPLAMVDWSSPKINQITSRHKILLSDITEKLKKITNHSKPTVESDLFEFQCDPKKSPCLFHLEQDPCEEHNLAHLFSDVESKMKERLFVLKQSVRPPLNQAGDPLADPQIHRGVWTHWRDPESQQKHYLSELYSSTISFTPMYFSTQMNSVVENLTSSVWSACQTILMTTAFIATPQIILNLRNIVDTMHTHLLKK